MAIWYSQNFENYYLEIMRHENVDNLTETDHNSNSTSDNDKKNIEINK